MNIGDVIEVKYATHDGYIWIKATVFAVYPKGFVVKCSNGLVKEYDMDSDLYRIPIKD